MHRRRHGKPFMFMLLMPLAVLGFGAIVMLLWNAILPALLGVGLISYWKAVGLLILSRILFGSFGRGGFGGHRHCGPPSHMREKFMNMTDEERQKFKEAFKQRFHAHE